MSSKVVFLESKRIIMRPLREEDFTEEHLMWLNDPDVNEYSQRRPFPFFWDEIKKYNEYYIKNPLKGFVLAIIDKKTLCHIGNISLVNIQLVNRCAEIAILIGNKNYWKKGYAAESIYTLTKHAFLQMNLHKIFAGTFNPAFEKCVINIGWIKEGDFRERIWSNGKYHNQIWLSMLRREFKEIERYEK